MVFLSPSGNQNLRADDGREQAFNITAIIVHPHYDKITYDNDVALVKLETTASLNDYVNTLCLPKELAPPSMRCMVAGWGATMEHGPASDELMKAEVPIVDSSACARPDVYGTKITKNMMCAGYAHGGIDTCQGDSGGPLHCRNREDPRRWEVQGIASWGSGCGRQLRYGVYTKVWNYLPWIECILKDADSSSRSLGAQDRQEYCNRNLTERNSSKIETVQPKSAQVGITESIFEMGGQTTAVGQIEKSASKSSVAKTPLSVSLQVESHMTVAFYSNIASSSKRISVVSTTASHERGVYSSVTLHGASQTWANASEKVAYVTKSLKNLESVYLQVTATRKNTKSTIAISAVSGVISRPDSLTGINRTSIANKTAASSDATRQIAKSETIQATVTLTTSQQLSYVGMASTIQKSGMSRQIDRPYSLTTTINRTLGISLVPANVTFGNISSSVVAINMTQYSTLNLTSSATRSYFNMQPSIATSRYVNAGTVMPKMKSSEGIRYPYDALCIAVVILSMGVSNAF